MNNITISKYNDQICIALQRGDEENAAKLIEAERVEAEARLKELESEVTKTTSTLLEYEGIANNVNDRRRLRFILSETTRYKRICKELNQRFLDLNRKIRGILK